MKQTEPEADPLTGEVSDLTLLQILLVVTGNLRVNNSHRYSIKLKG